MDIQTRISQSLLRSEPNFFNAGSLILAKNFGAGVQSGGIQGTNSVPVGPKFFKRNSFVCCFVGLSPTPEKFNDD